ncbi:hypothetical protein [Parafilimonas sp.]|uniref:hypothetical protein n=1 Tax=Parafilimonas sp. TaxID=1969739 RepID=UPI0039E34905
MEQPEQEQAKKRAGKLRILFRLAFICNIFFIVCIIMRYTTAPRYIPQPLVELAVILGWLAPVINLINFVLALLLLSRIRNKQVPVWLLYVNIICFLLQIYFFFILKDVPYT